MTPLTLFLWTVSITISGALLALLAVAAVATVQTIKSATRNPRDEGKTKC